MSSCLDGGKRKGGRPFDGAIKTRILLPTELIQLTTFMLNNSNVMEEWRNFYENAKSMNGRSRIFPTFHKYMKEKLAEVDQLLA